ncbi:MAG TPA: ribosome maturation factor RimP [Burkholderiales bacterium]|nr:ribosome maturation factor RimP [Burkholderiales bacterium]
MGSVEQVLETTIGGLGYELVDFEFGRGRFMRVFIDHPATKGEHIKVEDCELVTRQLQRVLPVEGIEYERLEVSSPGLDRVLKKPADFRRFVGEKAEVRLRIALEGRRRFTGVLKGASDEALELDVEGNTQVFPFTNVDKARLVPKL